MSSIIEQIYTALDAMPVTYLDKDNDSVTPTCYTLSETPDSVQTAHLPARLLILPTSSMTIGPGPEVTGTYTIQDMFLLEAVGQGGGTKIQSPVILRYISAYQDAIAKKWQFQSTWQTEAITTNVTLTPGKLVYPANSDNVFYGVMVSITVEELY